MRSLHFKLFWRYALLIFFLSAVFMLLLYHIMGNEFRSNAQGELQADCDNISTLLDTQVEQMDQLSKRIVDSRQLRALYLEDNYSGDADSYYHKNDFSNALFDIIRLSFDHLRLNMFDMSGRFIHVGDSSIFKYQEPESITGVPWVEPALEIHGKKLLLAPRIPELNTASEPVLSLVRAFAPENPVKETAILELQMEYSYIENKIADAIHNQKDKKKIFVYNHAGERIYPYGDEVPAETENYIQDFLKSEGQESGKLYRTVNSSNAPILFVINSSAFTEWTVIVSEAERDLFAAFFSFQQMIIAASVLVLVLMLILTNRIAAGLSTPIRKLEQTVCSLDLNHLEKFELPEYKNSYRELASLYHSFGEMKENLQNSLQNTIDARTQAVNAQMLALQSQMNPHFLYNTLSSISILAEDGENEKVIKMCDDLSMLLRYIASGAGAMVTIEEEIKHTVSYMNLIKVKYEERIQFAIDIPEEMRGIKVPKLMIQPLVENSVKYGLNVTPPWVIEIHGECRDGYWYLMVKDNGTGFTEEYLNSFWEEAKGISDESRQIPELEVNGMGILNLYLRLWLLYGKRMFFKLGNRQDGGAQITIGGPLDK